MLISLSFNVIHSSLGALVNRANMSL